MSALRNSDPCAIARQHGLPQIHSAVAIHIDIAEVVRLGENKQLIGTLMDTDLSERVLLPDHGISRSQTTAWRHATIVRRINVPSVLTQNLPHASYPHNVLQRVTAQSQKRR